MNYIEFITNSTDYYRRNKDTQRFGQAVSNFLGLVRPDIASQLIDSELDPYYKDAVTVQVWEFIHSKW